MRIYGYRYGYGDVAAERGSEFCEELVCADEDRRLDRRIGGEERFEDFEE